MKRPHKSISILLEPDGVELLDKLCTKLDWNRSQLLRGLVSGDKLKIDLIAAKAKEINKLF